MWWAHHHHTQTADDTGWVVFILSTYRHLDLSPTRHLVRTLARLVDEKVLHVEAVGAELGLSGHLRHAIEVVLLQHGEQVDGHDVEELGACLDEEDADFERVRVMGRRRRHAFLVFFFVLLEIGWGLVKVRCSMVGWGFWIVREDGDG